MTDSVSDSILRRLADSTGVGFDARNVGFVGVTRYHMRIYRITSTTCSSTIELQVSLVMLVLLRGFRSLIVK